MSELPLSASFGEIIRSHRKAAGLTQEELAERASVHPTYVGLVERGERNPSLDIAERIAEALGAPLSELIRAAEGERGATRKGGGKRK